jgi:TolB protein
LTLPQASAPPASATFPGANGQVAFVAFRFDGEADPPRVSRSLDVAFPNGSNRRSLRGCTSEILPRQDCSISYRSPAWSPSGRHLAFDAGPSLAVVRSDGSGFRMLPQQTVDDGEPAWSPDGGRLVFTGRSDPNGPTDLYVMDLVSGNSYRLTTGSGRSPDWSSRGRIAFVRGSRSQAGYQPGTGDVYTMGSDGSGLRRITHRRGGDPSWSPHGTKILFTRQRRFGSFHLYVVRADGRGLHQLDTADVGSPEAPSWSPDGKRVAYAGFEAGVWTQRLDGRGVRELAGAQRSAESGYDASAPAWQPLPR